MLGERDPATQQKGAQTIGQTGLPEGVIVRSAQAGQGRVTFARFD
jgi:hypothetical protein